MVLPCTDADQMDRDFKVKLEPVKEEADLEVTINTLAESRCFDVAEPADDVDGDHELSVEFYPSTSPLETAFSRKMRARVSIASISSNLSKQFGRRRSMELEDGEELITSTNGAEMDSNSGSNDIDGGGKGDYCNKSPIIVLVLNSGYVICLSVVMWQICHSISQLGIINHSNYYYMWPEMGIPHCESPCTTIPLQCQSPQDSLMCLHPVKTSDYRPVGWGDLEGSDEPPSGWRGPAGLQVWGTRRRTTCMSGPGHVRASNYSTQS